MVQKTLAIILVWKSANKNNSTSEIVYIVSHFFSGAYSCVDVLYKSE